MLGVHKKLGRDTAGADDLNTPKGYSRPLTHYAQSKKLGNEEVKVGYSEWQCLSPEVTVRHRWRPAFLETFEHLSVCGKWWMNPLVCFTWAQLFFPYWTVFTSIHVFFHFYFSTPLPQEGKEWKAVRGLSGCLGLNHDNFWRSPFRNCWWGWRTNFSVVSSFSSYLSVLQIQL